MYIPRDITQLLNQDHSWIQVLLGPRQCGKSTLLATLNPTIFQEICFDDLALRRLANQDPAFFLDQYSGPLLLDEIQYVPNLFPELKRRVDLLKRVALRAGKSQKNLPLYRLTGSNQILMDQNVKESLAGRAHYYALNTLSVHEIQQALPDQSLKDILFKGGWPELYGMTDVATIPFLNSYIQSYVEKDIVLSSGIQKLQEFHTVLALLAARTGQLSDYSELAKASGVRSVTIKEWLSLLERSDLIYKLPPFFNNLSKRLIKTPKWYFLDTGLASRLQGWTDSTPLLHSPQAGPLFETLVCSELLKFIRNRGKDWRLHLWRTKEGEEIDFLLETRMNTFYVFDAKLSLQGQAENRMIPLSLDKTVPLAHPLCFITFAGQKRWLSKHCLQIPISQLYSFLEEISE